MLLVAIQGCFQKMLQRISRDRGCEIQIFPLSFKEYYEYSGLEKADAWEEYMTYGGMPLAVLEKNEAEKAEYLKNLFTKIYIADIKERYKLKDEDSVGRTDRRNLFFGRFAYKSP